MSSNNNSNTNTFVTLRLDSNNSIRRILQHIQTPCLVLALGSTLATTRAMVKVFR